MSNLLLVDMGVAVLDEIEMSLIFLMQTLNSSSSWSIFLWKLYWTFQSGIEDRRPRVCYLHVALHHHYNNLLKYQQQAG